MASLERGVPRLPGLLVVALLLLVSALAAWLFLAETLASIIGGSILALAVLVAATGFTIVLPNQSRVLHRQQADAVVAARTRIVEGAVGMVENAL